MPELKDNILDVLIVGCGNIAGGFDQTQKLENLLPCTHAGAYSIDKRFSLQGCIEPDEQKCKSFMEHWNIPRGYSSMSEALEAGFSYDVISICSPTFKHFDDVMLAIELNPTLIFCEKPITDSVEKTLLLIDACKNAKTLLAVNHNRRWDSYVQKIKMNIESGELGELGVLRSVVAYYNKGILNNGSHLIDLLYFLLGEMEIVATLNKINDFSLEDPTVPALLKSKEGVPIHLVTAHSKDYSLFELQIIGSKGEAFMKDAGMNWSLRKVVKSELFNGYNNLDQAVIEPGGYRYAMSQAIDNIYKAITVGDALLSDGSSASESQKFCEQIAMYNPTG